MKAIPAQDFPKGRKDLDLPNDSMSVERALGVHWCVEGDTFQFRITLKDQSLTRRGVLSAVSSVYHRLGLRPLLFQKMCGDGLVWDSPLPEDLSTQWQHWRTELFSLK